MIESPIEILAPLVALAVAYVLFYEGMLYNVGGDGKFWRTLRSYLPYFDEEARDAGFYTQYKIKETEFVGYLHKEVGDSVQLFYGLGFKDNPLAAHKEDWEGRREVASLGLYYSGETVYDGNDIESWGKMKRFLMMTFVIRRQVHVTLFEEDGKVVVTAHDEWSPYNVFKAYDHLRANDYNVQEGVERVSDMLEETEKFEA